MSISAKKIKILINNLSSPDTRKRHIAAEELSEGDERVILPLIKALKDENPGVQDAAMRALIKIGGEVTAYMVIPLLRDEPLLRNTALIILKEIGQITVPLLKPLLKDKDYDIRKFALDLICEIKHCDYVEEIVRLLKEDPNPNVRASAAKTIGILQYKSAITELVDALKDEEWVCFSALESLSRFKDSSTIKPIIDLLDNSSESIRYAAIDTLGKIGSAEAGKALLEYFKYADDFEKQIIVKSLVQINVVPHSSDIAETLKDILKNGDWDEKMIALKGLADIRESSAVKDIIDLAGSLDSSEPEDEEKLLIIKEMLKTIGCSDSLIEILNDPKIRYRGRKIAIEILGELKCRKAVPYIMRLLEEDFRDVRRAAAHALADMPDEFAGNILLDAIDDEDGHVRKEAIAALGKIGDKTAFIPLLNHLFVEPYKDVTEEAVKALLSIDTESVFKHIGEFPESVKESLAKNTDDIEMLLYLSNDANINVRSSAVKSLGKAEDERAYKRLTEAIHDKEPEVRKSALIALGEMNCCYDEIKSALEDPDMWVRVYAVKTLSRSLKQDAINSFRHMLMDREIPVVLSTIEAVAQLGKDEAFGILNPLLEHEEEAVRRRVQQIIFGDQMFEEEGVEI